jgi:GTP cyclohydrolase FolE2
MTSSPRLLGEGPVEEAAMVRPEPMVDVQNQFDTRKIKIDKVGVKNIRYPISVKDRATGSQRTVA